MSLCRGGEPAIARVGKSFCAFRPLRTGPVFRPSGEMPPEGAIPLCGKRIKAVHCGERSGTQTPIISKWRLRFSPTVRFVDSAAVMLQQGA
jgi:hypothetical protein